MLSWKKMPMKRFSYTIVNTKTVTQSLPKLTRPDGVHKSVNTKEMELTKICSRTFFFLLPLECPLL